jgi:hypothetical protein
LFLLVGSVSGGFVIILILIFLHLLFSRRLLAVPEERPRVEMTDSAIRFEFKARVVYVGKAVVRHAYVAPNLTDGLLAGLSEAIYLDVGLEDELVLDQRCDGAFELIAWLRRRATDPHDEAATMELRRTPSQGNPDKF